MVFNNSIVNKLDFLYKPYAKRVLEHFEVRFSFVSRTQILDPLYAVTMYRMRPRFLLLKSLDLEGKFIEPNIIMLLSLLHLYTRLETIKLENGTTQLDLFSVLGNPAVKDTGIVDKYHIDDIWVSDEFRHQQSQNIRVMREVRGQMSRFISIGQLKGERLVRKLEIRYIPKEAMELKDAN